MHYLNEKRICGFAAIDSFWFIQKELIILKRDSIIFPGNNVAMCRLQYGTGRKRSKMIQIIEYLRNDLCEYEFQAGSRDNGNKVFVCINGTKPFSAAYSNL